MRNRTDRVFVNGRFSPRTGIGVVQRALYPRLISMGLDVVATGPEFNDRSEQMPPLRLLRTLFMRMSRRDTFLCVASPLPLNVPRHVVSIVHDLRWIQTRGIFSRAYRLWDLRRIVRRSFHIVCISATTREQMIAVIPEAADKSSVAWLGSGLAERAHFNNVSNGQLLMNGAAPHKRNELLARVLVRSKPDWLERVVGVGISSTAAEELRRGFGDAFIARSFVSDEEMKQLYAESQYFAHFGVSEGFGMPYVEALSSGCEVIAIDQPLTREILGDAAWLVPDGTEDELASSIAVGHSVASSVRQAVAARFSWDTFAGRVGEVLRSAMVDRDQQS